MVLTVSSQDGSGKSGDTDVKDPRGQGLVLGKDRLDFTCKNAVPIRWWISSKFLFICIWPILLPTLNSSLKLDPLVDSAVDLNPSISQDITDSLSCYLDMGDEGVGLLDQDDFWCRTRVD
jgi:hypothetical protein